MAREKQHVFSARTTEEGLKALNELKASLKMSWDELVIEAVNTQYNLDKAMMTLPKKEKPAKEVQTTEQQASADTTSEAHPAEKTTEERPPEEKRLEKKRTAKGGRKANKAKN